MKTLIVTYGGLMANLWRAAFENDPVYSVLAVETSLESAMPKLDEVDLILINITGHLEDGVRMVQEIMEHSSKARVIAVGVPREEHTTITYMEAGASGTLSPNSSLEQLRDMMDSVSRGEAIVEPDIAPALVKRLHSLNHQYKDPDTTGQRLQKLTPREREVLQQVSRRKTNRQIAEELVIEIGTVKNHVHSILEKLEFDSRYEAASYYHLCEDSPEFKIEI